MSAGDAQRGGVPPPRGYLAPTLALAAMGVFKPGTVTIGHVYHDGHCRRPDGGPCTCSPEIALEDDGAGAN